MRTVRAVLVDSFWKLKRYLKDFEDPKIVVDPDTDSKISRMKDLFFSYGLMETSMVIARSIDEWKKEERKWLAENVKDSSAEVVITSGTPEPLKGFGKAENLLSPKTWDFHGWIKEIDDISGSFAVELDEDEKTFIIEHVGMNIDMIVKEIEKVSVISNSPSMEDVVSIITSHVGPNIFDFNRIFFSKNERAVTMVRSILEDVHPMVVLRNLEKGTMVLAQILSLEGESYSWEDVKNLSQTLGVPSPQIADMVGFPLGGKKRMNVTKLWNLAEATSLLEELQDVEIRMKLGSDPFFSLLELIGKWTSKRRGNLVIK